MAKNNFFTLTLFLLFLLFLSGCEKPQIQPTIITESKGFYFYQKGKELYSGGKYNDASVVYDSAINLLVNDKSQQELLYKVYFNQASSFSRLGAYSESVWKLRLAERLLEDMDSEEINIPEKLQKVRYFMAINLREGGNLIESEGIFKQLLKESELVPNLHSNVVNSMGYNYLASKDYNKAIEMFDQAIESNGEKSEILKAHFTHSKAEAYYRMGKLDLAIETVQKAIPILEKDKKEVFFLFEMLRDYAEMLVDVKRPMEANKQIERALSLFPERKIEEDPVLYKAYMIKYISTEASDGRIPVAREARIKYFDLQEERERKQKEIAAKRVIREMRANHAPIVVKVHNSNVYMLIIAGCGVVFLILGVVFIFQRRKYRKKKEELQKVSNTLKNTLKTIPDLM